jgi:hypothetical protein
VAKYSGKKMTEDELRSLIDSQMNSAAQYNRNELIERREKTLLFLNGKVDFGVQADKSSVVCNDLADLLNSVMPSLLRVFTSADQLVVYTPRRPEFDPTTGQDISTEKASQATDYINYIFQQDCDGYRVIHSALYSGVAFGNGIIKHWWDPDPVETIETLTGITELAFMQLSQDPSVKIHPESVKKYADPAVVGPDDEDTAEEDLGDEDQESAIEDADLDEETGMEAPEILPEGATQLADYAEDALEQLLAPPLLYDLRLTRTQQVGRVCVKAVPDEEFMISKEAVSLTEEGCGGFVGHAYRETRGELLRQGIAREKIEKLSASAWTQLDNNKEERAEYSYRPTEVERDWAEELVWVYETYIRCDYEGKGQSKWQQVLCGGEPGSVVILRRKLWGGMLPFSDFVPEPIPHRWHGRSLLDNVYDYTRVRTTILRQALDNAYQTNNPMTYVEEESITNIDVLAERELGGVVIGRVGAAPPRPLDVPFTAQQSFGMFETLGEMLEQRTGIARQGPALDAKALQNQTATAVQASQATAYSRPETFARNISQMGMKRMFACILKLVCANQDRARAIRLRGKWIEMNPRAWDAEMDVAVNIGLGSGSRDRDIQTLTLILAEQKQAIAQLAPKVGLMNNIVGVDKLINTYHKLIEASGLRNPDQFFGTPTPEEMKILGTPPQAPTDPKIEQIKMQGELEVAKLQATMQGKVQEHMAKLEADRNKQIFDMQMEAEAAKKDVLLQQAQLDKQAEIERIQAQADIAVQQSEAAAARQLEELRAVHDAQLQRMKLEQSRTLETMRMAMEGLKGNVASGDILAVLQAFGISMPGDLPMRMDAAGVERMAEEAAAESEGVGNGEV